MKGWLRSWKLCEVRSEVRDGVAGWRKRRLKRVALRIPPGNLFMGVMSSGCRVIDFETTLPDEMEARQGRARDFAILALDLWKRRAGTLEDFKSWQDAYGNDENFCPVGCLFRNPGCLLRGYWRLLGYGPPLVF
jgi:hypothetical protein